MSLDKLVDGTKLDNSLTATASAIRAKTGVPDSINFDFIGETGFASAIDAIPVQAQSTLGPKDINFWDFDGTLLYSYTKAEFLQLTEMPALPTHARLIAQNWNWSYADAVDFVTNTIKYLNIGALYTTASGGTEVDIRLSEDIGLTPSLGLGVEGTVTIDWGDGSATSTLTGTSTSTFYFTSPHTYATAGLYTITITPVNSALYRFLGDSTYGCKLIYADDDVAQNRRYRAIIENIRCGLGCEGVGAYGLYCCYGLLTISNSNSSTLIGDHSLSYCTSLSAYVQSGNSIITSYAFYSAVSLIVFCGSKDGGRVSYYSFSYTRNMKNATFPNQAVTVSSSAFESASSLIKVVIPSTVRTIYPCAFRSCNTLKSFHLLSQTPPELKAISAFTSTPTDYKFYVPRSTDQTVLNAYQTATNWATYSTRFEEEPI